MVRIAQGLVHMGKGTMSLNPYHRYKFKSTKCTFGAISAWNPTLHKRVGILFSIPTLLCSVGFQPDWLTGNIPVLQYSTSFINFQFDIVQAYVWMVKSWLKMWLNWLIADRIYIRKYFITSPLNKSKEKSTRYENLFILHDLIEFYKPHNT